jgi:pimeloyl-ACP methyl ester carboxylesterase
MNTRIRLLSALLFCTLSASAQQASPLSVNTRDLPQSKSVSVLGQRIVYYDAGAGPVLVLVHGFGSQASFDWGHVIPPLAKHHHVIALDQIGFGASDKPAIDYSIQTFVDFLGEFLRTLRIQHFDLAGESLGGWIVANYTIQALAPANHGPYSLPVPARLILEDAAGHAALTGHVAVQGSFQEAAGIAIVFHNKSLVTEEFIRQSWEQKLRANDGQTERLLWGNPKLASETVVGKLQAITVPTLVVWGRDDEIVPLADGQDYASKIPGAKLVVIPECGHAPSIEKPQEFLAAVDLFLK